MNKIIIVILKELFQLRLYIIYITRLYYDLYYKFIFLLRGEKYFIVRTRRRSYTYRVSNVFFISGLRTTIGAYR